MEVESSAKICTTSHLLRQYAREHRCTESTPSRGKPVLLCSLVHFVSCQVDAVDDCHAARAIELSLANRLGSCSDAVRKVKEVEPVHQNQADTVRKFPTVLSLERGHAATADVHKASVQHHHDSPCRRTPPEEVEQVQQEEFLRSQRPQDQRELIVDKTTVRTE